MRKFLLCSLVLLLAAGVAFATEEDKKLDADQNPPVPGTRALVCDNAIVINCGDTVSGDNTGLTSTADAYSCVGWTESGGELVYELTLTVEQIVAVTLSNMTADMDVFFLGSCDENDCLYYGDSQFTTSCLDPGTYYIVVDGYNGAQGSFDLAVACADCPTPQENENCDTAIDLCEAAGTEKDGTFDLPYSTIGMASDYPLVYTGSCTGYSVSGADIVYVVCLDPGGTLDVTQTGDFDMAMFLMTDCADPQNSCVVGSDNCCTGADEFFTYTSVNGGTYYLVVAGYSSEGTGTVFGSVTGCCATSTEQDSWTGVKELFR